MHIGRFRGRAERSKLRTGAHAMVEVAGVEPASYDLLDRASTCLVPECNLAFPTPRDRCRKGQHRWVTAHGAVPTTNYICSMTPQPVSRHPRRDEADFTPP